MDFELPPVVHSHLHIISAGDLRMLRSKDHSKYKLLVEFWI
jgi:hypothetical protein